MNRAPAWTLEPGAEPPPLEKDLDVETLIVGGGIAGVSLACTLASQGASVGLIEARSLGDGASGRSAGFLTLAPPEPYRELIALWGREGARAALALGRRSHQKVREWVESLGLECDYRARGSLRLATTEDEAADLRASLPDLHVDGFRVLETPVAAEVPAQAAERFAAAFVTAEDGEVDPLRLVRGLARAAAEGGAGLFCGSPLRSARWSGGSWEVVTPLAVARSRTLVLCANAYAPRICPALAPVIAPRRGQMLLTAPIPRVVAARPTLARWGYRYWRQLGDGRLMIGGWRDLAPDDEVGYEAEPTPLIQSAIEGGLAELVPEGAAIERRWAGTMGFSRDGRPLVGWLDPEHHLAIAAGFTGHGLSWAPACAVDLAELLSWRNPSGIATLDPARFAELRGGRDRLTILDAAVD